MLHSITGKNSSHLIAKAITDAYLEEFLPVENFKEHPGKGLAGHVNGKNILSGTLQYLKENGVQTPDEQVSERIKMGYSAACVAIDGKFAGFITLSDSIREDSAEMLRLLAKRGVKPVILTGDNSSASCYACGKA